MRYALKASNRALGGLSITKDEDEDIILITKEGTVIKHSVKNMRLCSKGDLGCIGIDLTKRQNNKDRIIQIYKSNQLIGGDILRPSQSKLCFVRVLCSPTELRMMNCQKPFGV